MPMGLYYRNGIKPKTIGGQKRFRKALIERNGLVCSFCGTVSGNFEADHIVPYCMTGDHSEYNGRILCFPCHQRDYKHKAKTKAMWDGTQWRDIFWALRFCPEVDKRLMIR